MSSGNFARFRPFSKSLRSQGRDGDWVLCFDGDINSGRVEARIARCERSGWPLDLIADVASLTSRIRPPVRELESVPYSAMTFPDKLEVMELSDHEWRVCNAELDERDANRVLAYVEKRGWYYELTRLRSPGERLRFFSLTESLAALVTV